MRRHGNMSTSISNLDSFIIGFGATALPWAIDKFPLSNFSTDFLETYRKVARRNVNNSILFIPNDSNSFKKTYAFLKDALNIKQSIPGVLDLGIKNNLKFFKENLSADGRSLWFIEDKPLKITTSFNDVLESLNDARNALENNLSCSLGIHIAQCSHWNGDIDDKIKHIANSLISLAAINSAVASKVERSYKNQFEKELLSDKGVFYRSLDRCRAIYSPQFTRIPDDDYSTSIFMQIFEKYINSLNSNFETMKNELNSALKISLPNDSSTCLAYLHAHNRYIYMLKNLPTEHLDQHPLLFSEHYHFSLTWKLFKLTLPYFEQQHQSTKESIYSRSEYHLISTPASHRKKEVKNIKSIKVNAKRCLKGTVEYALEDISSRNSAYHLGVKSLRVRLHDALPYQSQEWEFPERQKNITQAAEQLFIVAASKNGSFNKEDIHVIMRKIGLKATEDQGNQILKRLDYFICLAAGKAKKGRDKPKAFILDENARKSIPKITIKDNQGNSKSTYNTTYRSELCFIDINAVPSPEQV